mmetsp:Transcript_36259/g.116432  ORF Transcript_36259/g.116432 Transcript_36259/m.116432 type:complete len:245 (+) Transcript_36259:403-1137(+)
MECAEDGPCSPNVNNATAIVRSASASPWLRCIAGLNALLTRTSPSSALEDAGDEDEWDALLVFCPVGAVLDRAEMVIAPRTVHQQHRKVDWVKVGDGCARAAGKRPSEAHHPVAGVIDFSCHAPPARHQKLGAALRLHPLQVADVFSRGIAPEGVLLGVCAAKHAVAQYVEERHPYQCRHGEGRVVVDENASLERVREGNPREVSKGEHEAETVGRDVHSGEDRLLIIERVPNIDELERIDQEH